MVQKGNCSGGYYCSTALIQPFTKTSPLLHCMLITRYLMYRMPYFEVFKYLDYRSPLIFHNLAVKM